MTGKRFQGMRWTMRRPLITATLVGIFLVCSPARADDVLARFETGTVTRDDVDRAVARQGLPATAQNRTAALRALVAGYAVEEQLGRGGKTLPPELDKAVADARRQVMLNYYLDKQLKRNKPEAGAIDDFVRKNPQFFGNRATYRYVRLLIDGGGKPLPDSVQAAIRQLQGGGRPTIAGVNRLKAVLRGVQLPTAAQEFYQGSEQLGPEQLRDLEAMASGGQRPRLRQLGQASELIVLIDRIPDPVDPADMRMQIANGLMTQDVQAQSQRLIDEIGAAKLDELRRARLEDADEFNLTGKADPSLKTRAAQASDGGSVLNLFGRQTASDADEGEDSVLQGGADMGAMRRAALFLGLIGLLAPLAVAASFVAGGGLSDNRRHRGVIVAAGIALAVAGGVLFRARPLIEPLGGRMFLSVLIGGSLAGCLGALAWRRSERSRQEWDQGAAGSAGAGQRGAIVAVLALGTLTLALWMA